MPHKYRFTADHPLIFSELSHGPDVTIEHTTDADTELPPVPEDGATVVLYPGDSITLKDAFVHAWLEGDTSKAEQARQEKARAADEKALADQAAERAEDDARLAAQLDALFPAHPNDEAEPGDATDATTGDDEEEK
jgi:hypothetical protein